MALQGLGTGDLLSLTRLDSHQLYIWHRTGAHLLTTSIIGIMVRKLLFPIISSKQNSETKKYISKAEHIKTENNRSQYRIAPIVSDMGALCINRAGLYLIKLGQTGGVFNSASIKKIYEEGNDAKIQIDKDGKAIIFECDIYSNPIFISVFK